MAEIRGVTLLEPQARITCVDCEQDAGSEEYGNYFIFPVEGLEKEIDQHGWHVIAGAVVCDECAWKRDQETAA